MKIAFLYTLFALVATATNIGAQDMVVRCYHGVYPVLLSVAVGTVVGLVVKYVLDKKYIFRFRAQNAMHDSRTFALYSVMGLVTTVVFWGFEFGFDHVFASREMRYLGGVIGLSVGYLLKYNLDKRFVFRRVGS